MKMKSVKPQSSIALILDLLCLSSPPVGVASASQREREVQNPATPQTTASPSPTPVASPQSPPAPSLKSEPTKSLAELRSRISDILARPDLSSAMVGIKVSSLDTGQVLFEENANKLLRPASNMKLYTLAAALDRLSPDYRFVTSVYAKEQPDS